jgi:hypothetical protein
MAERDIVGGLFGVTPEMYQQQRQQQQLAEAVRMGSLTPEQFINTQAYRGGQALGNVAGSLLGVEDPQLMKIRDVQQMRTQFDVSTPAGLREFAQALGQKGYTDLAVQATAKAADIDKDIAAAVKSRRESTPAAEEQAKRIRLNELVEQLGEVEGAKQFNKEQQEGRVRVAAAAVPAPGMVGIGDLKGGTDIVDRYTKEPKTKLDAIGIVSTQLEAVKTNPTLLPQVQRSLVKIVGDSQIGQNEVKNILGSSGFAADVIDGVNKFFTGAPTDAKIDDVLRGVKVMEEYYAKKYSSGRERAGRVLGNAKLDQRTIDDLMPPAYRAGSPSLDDFLARARTANPGVSDTELTNYYNNKYRLSK